MELTVGKLKEILNEVDDNVILATLDRGNDDFRTYSMVKRLLVLKCKESGVKYLTINPLGSHFTGKGDQSHLEYDGVSFH